MSRSVATFRSNTLRSDDHFRCVGLFRSVPFSSVPLILITLFRSVPFSFLPFHPVHCSSKKTYFKKANACDYFFRTRPLYYLVVGKSPSRTVPDRTYDCTRSWYPENNGFRYRLLSLN